MTYWIIPGLPKPKRKLTRELITSVTAEYFKIVPSLLYTASRTKPLSRAREIAIYFIRKELGLTVKQIGYIFYRDHSTVVEAIKRVRRFYILEPDYKADIDKIQNLLYS